MAAFKSLFAHVVEQAEKDGLKLRGAGDGFSLGDTPEGITLTEIARRRGWLRPFDTWVPPKSIEELFKVLGQKWPPEGLL